MTRMLLVFLLLGSLSVPLAGQTQTAPSTPRPAPRPAARATATAPTALNIQVTDTMGAPLANTRVTLQGPVSREGTTEENGALRLTNMRAGTYRVRLVRDGSITLERDLVMRAGESLTVDIALSAAPLPPKLPEPVKPVAPEPVVKMLPPPVDPKITPVPLFLEKNFIGREGRKDSLLGCTPTAGGLAGSQPRRCRRVDLRRGRRGHTSNRNLGPARPGGHVQLGASHARSCDFAARAESSDRHLRPVWSSM
jgi:hypothetical protein